MKALIISPKPFGDGKRPEDRSADAFYECMRIARLVDIVGTENDIHDKEIHPEPLQLISSVQGVCESFHKVSVWYESL